MEYRVKGHRENKPAYWSETLRASTEKLLRWWSIINQSYYPQAISRDTARRRKNKTEKSKQCNEQLKHI